MLTVLEVQQHSATTLLPFNPVKLVDRMEVNHGMGRWPTSVSTSSISQAEYQTYLQDVMQRWYDDDFDTNDFPRGLASLELFQRALLDQEPGLGPNSNPSSSRGLGSATEDDTRFCDLLQV